MEGLALLLASPAIAHLEVALGAAFFIAGLLVSRDYFYPAIALLLPNIVYYSTPDELSAIYYYSLASIAIAFMIRFLSMRLKRWSQGFFTLCIICVILALVTTHIQHGDAGSAPLLGLAFVASWWAMDALLIWMAVNGEFS